MFVTGSEIVLGLNYKSVNQSQQVVCHNTHTHTHTRNITPNPIVDYFVSACVFL